MSAALPQGGDERPVGIILSQLWDKTELLVRQELALGLEELDRRTDRFGDKIKRAAMGGAVVFAGALALLAAAILFVAQYIAAWMSAGLFGLVVTTVGYLLVRSAEPSALDAGETSRTDTRKNFNRNEATHDAA